MQAVNRFGDSPRLVTGRCARCMALMLLALLIGSCADNDHNRRGVDGNRIFLADREPGNWMSHGRTYDEQRCSPLTEINEDNIDRLGLTWSYDFDTHRGLEEAFEFLELGVNVGIDGAAAAWPVDPAIRSAIRNQVEEVVRGCSIGDGLI